MARRKVLTYRHHQAIVAKHGKNCWYCGIQCVDVILIVEGRVIACPTIFDHQMPLSKGGASDESNLVPVCNACNSRKSVKDVEAYRTYVETKARAVGVRFYGEGERESHRLRFVRFWESP